MLTSIINWRNKTIRIVAGRLSPFELKCFAFEQFRARLYHIEIVGDLSDYDVANLRDKTHLMKNIKSIVALIFQCVIEIVL